MENTAPKKRIELIDAMRGFCVVLMVIHHFLLDLVELCSAPIWLFSNPVFNVLHYFFAGMFIFLSGVSSNFSRSNIIRGIKCFAIAMAMTIITSLPFINAPIRFGVLHLLGFSMVFYGLTYKIWDSIPRFFMPFLCVFLIIGTSILVTYTNIGNSAKYLFMFGWTYEGFVSADWFPIFPWLFVFLLGTWAGHYIKEHRLPKWFYEKNVPVFPEIGRRALIIYVLHQPVFYGLIYLVKYLIK